MITCLSGTVKAIHENAITLMVDSIGFNIYTPAIGTLELDKLATLHISFQWNTELGPSLFGFVHLHDKKLFELIIGCPGIGPRIALTALTHVPAEQILNAIISQDEKTLSSIPGIGKKKAEQIIICLKDKVEKLIKDGTIALQENSYNLQEIIQVLASLDYSKAEIQAAIGHLKQDTTQNLTFDGKLRKALNYLSKHS